MMSGPEIDESGHQVIHDNVHDDATVAETAVVGDNSTIAAGARVYDFAVIRDSRIGENAVIGSYTLIRDSDMADASMAGAHAEIVRSRIGTDAGIHNGYIGDSVVHDGSRLGGGTIVANNRLNERPGTDPTGAEIGSNVRTGIHCLIMPGVSIGSNATIGPGTIVKDDVPEGSLFHAEQPNRRSRDRGRS